MPEMMKLYTEIYPYESRPGLNPASMYKKVAEETKKFNEDFERKLNEVLKQGWSLVNVIYHQTTVLSITAILKKQA